MRWSQVREMLAIRQIPRSGRLAILFAYATRWLRRGFVRVRVSSGVGVYIDRGSLSTDWELFRGMFLPRKAVHEADYRDATVLDIGAHKGYFGARALSHGAATVYSYEPERKNYALLARAARSLRGPRRWIPVFAAVGADDGTAEFHVSAESWDHSLVQPPQARQARIVTRETVEVVGIARVLREVLREAADRGSRLIVSLDVEGAECELVATAADWQLISVLFVEMHDRAPCEPEDVIRQLEEAGLVQTESPLPSILRFVRRDVTFEE
jgi:FkbM family methyltransferase